MREGEEQNIDLKGHVNIWDPDQSAEEVEFQRSISENTLAIEKQCRPWWGALWDVLSWSTLFACVLFWEICLLDVHFELSKYPPKDTRWRVHPLKTQISMRIHSIWSESSTGALLVAKRSTFLQAEN